MNDLSEYIKSEVDHGITFTSKGSYAEVIIKNRDTVWRLLLDEENFTRLILNAHDVLREITCRENK